MFLYGSNQILVGCEKPSDLRDRNWRPLNFSRADLNVSHLGRKPHPEHPNLLVSRVWSLFVPWLYQKGNNSWGGKAKAKTFARLIVGIVCVTLYMLMIVLWFRGAPFRNFGKTLRIKDITANYICRRLLEDSFVLDTMLGPGEMRLRVQNWISNYIFALRKFTTQWREKVEIWM